MNIYVAKALPFVGDIGRHVSVPETTGFSSPVFVMVRQYDHRANVT